MKTCQQCAEPIQDAAKVCPHCRRKQRWPLWVKVAIGLAIVVLIGFVNDAQNQEQPAATTRESSGNPAHDRLMTLSEDERRASLNEIVAGGGDTCGTVTKAFHQGIDKNDKRAYWNIACSSGHSYSIAVDANTRGSTKYVDCGVMATVGVACFKAFGE